MFREFLSAASPPPDRSDAPLRSLTSPAAQPPPGHYPAPSRRYPCAYFTPVAFACPLISIFYAVRIGNLLEEIGNCEYSCTSRRYSRATLRCLRSSVYSPTRFTT